MNKRYPRLAGRRRLIELQRGTAGVAISPDAPRMAAAARRLLQQSPYGALRQVECIVQDGVLTLEGDVPSFYHKQMAQTVLLHGIKAAPVIDNRLSVGREPAELAGMRSHARA